MLWHSLAQFGTLLDLITNLVFLVVVKHGVPVQPLEWLEAKVEEECTHTQVSSVRVFVACVPSHDPTRTLFISVSCVSAPGVLSF